LGLGNASAIANHIATRETHFRLLILSDLFTATMAIFLTLALYRLFKGVAEGLARLVVILRGADAVAHLLRLLPCQCPDGKL
jgi:Domain of unknown function (DUF4386)